MFSFSTFVLFVAIQQSLVLLIIAQSLDESPLIYNKCIEDGDNYTADSSYKEKRNRVLQTLSGNSNGFFYNSSVGEDNSTLEKVYALGLCRGDVKAVDCNGCLRDARYRLTGFCPDHKSAIAFYDYCMLHYSDEPLLGVMPTWPAYYLANDANVSSSSKKEFRQRVSDLISKLCREAAAGGTEKKFAASQNTSSSSNVTIYALTQCTPDLTQQQCTDCFQTALGFLRVDIGSVGARAGTPKCSIRYEMYAFFANVTADQTPTPSQPKPEKKSNTFRIVITTVAIAVFLILIASICIYLRFRKTKENFEEEIISEEALQFNFDSIKVATNNFSEENMLGQGGFGAVFKGRLWNEEEIAVKRLSKDSAQGDIEFKNEVELVAKLQHRNLVRLFGFALEKDERLLIYEFVPNGSLDNFIFDQAKRGDLDWDVRYSIIVGIGRGLLYLHEDSRLKIIHRDLKASNVLLDSKMNPKIADFGMARLFNLDQTQGETNRVVGTYGYMAPEYVMRGHFSVKSDVYSFGVLILEIVCGQKNSAFRHQGKLEDLLGYAWHCWQDEKSSNFIDPMMMTGSRSEILKCIHIGLLCVQQSISDRPTMNAVIQMLTSNSLHLPIPLQPAFFMYNDSGMLSGIGSSSGVTGLDGSNSVQKSTCECSITELTPR